MVQLIIFMTMIMLHGDLFSSQDNYEHLNKGYKLLGETKLENGQYPEYLDYMRGNPEYRESVSGNYVSRLPNLNDEERVKIFRTYYIVQIPSYKKPDGALVGEANLVRDITQWKHLCDEFMYKKVADIVAGNITRDTMFPIHININDKYAHLPFRERPVFKPEFRAFSLQEKIHKDQQAAYAMLSWNQKIRHNLFGGTLPDPFECENE